MCLKRLQDNNDNCPDFEVRFCCQRSLNQEDQTVRYKRVKREEIDPNKIQVNDIQRNIMNTDCLTL